LPDRLCLFKSMFSLSLIPLLLLLLLIPLSTPAPSSLPLLHAFVGPQRNNSTFLSQIFTPNSNLSLWLAYVGDSNTRHCFTTAMAQAGLRLKTNWNSSVQAYHAILQCDILMHCQFYYTLNDVAHFPNEQHRMTFTWLNNGDPRTVLAWLPKQHKPRAESTRTVILFNYGLHNLYYPHTRYETMMKNLIAQDFPKGFPVIFHETNLVRDPYYDTKANLTRNRGWNKSIPKLNKVLHEEIAKAVSERGSSASSTVSWEQHHQQQDQSISKPPKYCLVHSQVASQRNAKLLIDGVHYDESFYRWIVQADQVCLEGLLRWL